MAGAAQVVVVGVLGNPSVEECPCQVVHSVLFVLNCLGDDLGAEVIRKVVVEVALHREGLKQELLIVFLARGVAHDHSTASVVHQGAPRTAQHLQEVGERVVGPAMASRLVVLRAHDDYQVGPSREGPANRGRGNHHLDCPAGEEHADDILFSGAHGLVDERHAVLQAVLEGLVGHAVKVGLQVCLLHLQEPRRLALCGSKGEEVQCREPGVLASWNEHHCRLLALRVGGYGAVRRAAHGLHAGLKVGDVKALDVDGKGHGANARGKVEEAMAASADPLAEILGIGQRRAEADDSDALLCLRVRG
mmetsp:Transcript_3463/g.9986  ORF Transcript_3463/g.9986 Transcript_3463/m.9986 type:complete len:305 (+) Transcript_3463:1176-2090(+)